MNYNNLDLNLIKTFLCVYESKSILLASKKLFISQPAVTNSIKRLENFLGGPLFVRTPKGVIATTEGEQFNTVCFNAMKMIDNGINKFSSSSSLESGSLNIGSSSTIIRKLLLPFIEIFHKKYPKILITITDANTQKLEKYTKNGNVDLSIVNMPISDENAFQIVNVTKTNDCFIAKYDFEKDFLSKDELKKVPLILQKRPSSNRDYFEQMCAKNNVFYTPSFEIGSFGLMTDFVASGMGIAYTVKDFVLDDIKSGKIKEVKTNFDIPPRDVSVITLSSAINSFASQRFVQELVEFYKKK